ncbi:hypothetical protein OHA37_00010 [Streptomyces sp. NBC_00335]|uniref:hypothetical protein n=1 Tax=unclassified Streptomyces TaxID=2593676 RepID=UPI002257A616|nr:MULTISPECIES: hypothetical protein [unclassified Streptomyces]MCX5410155.1 hypothetical protein [Streptomyces sp. NBC_00086]
MSKGYSVLGSALTGAVTGWMGLALWQWADAADARACEESTSICFTAFPFIGIGLWAFLAVLMFAVALGLLGVRPLKVTVPACVALQMYALLLLPFLGDDVPQPSAATLTVLALVAVLVAVCTVPAWRRAGLVATGVLMLASFVVVGPPGDFL